MKPKKLVTFRVRESDYEKIKKIAAKKERKPTELLRIIVENYVSQYFSDISL